MKTNNFDVDSSDAAQDETQLRRKLPGSPFAIVALTYPIVLTVALIAFAATTLLLM